MNEPSLKPNLAILNATIKRKGFDPKGDHIQERIASSIYMDFRGFTDPNSTLQYMMPNEEHFTKMMRSINVGLNDYVIIYDKYRNISAPRTHFMMKCFGLPNVWVLNGTFAKWALEKRKIDKGDAPDAWKKQG